MFCLRVCDTIILCERGPNMLKKLIVLTSPAIPGIWGTASMGYEYNGKVLPLYHVRFTDSQIEYGHLLDDGFELVDSDKIVFFEETSPGKYLIRAENDKGYHYTLRSNNDIEGVLEKYETWDENEFPDKYRAGSSLWLLE